MGVWRTNLVVAIISAIGVAYGVALAVGFGFHLGASPIFQIEMFAASAACVAGPTFLWACYRDRPDSPLQHVKVFAARHRLRERFLVAAPALLCVSVFIAVFGAIKSGIPAITDYTLDPVLADMDEAIFGRAAWEVLQPLLGHPLISWVLNVAYHLWIVAFYAAAFWFAAWVERPALRAHFFVAFLLCWLLLGSVAAVLLPSVGPCFYQVFYHSDRFAPLMGYLQRADKVFHLEALEVQEILLDWYRSGYAGLGAGISAMPSMHVSIATLLALAARQVSRPWGIAGAVFLVLILLGSVHLGFHYAVDGIASLIATPLIWWASGWVVRRLGEPEGLRRNHGEVQPEAGRGEPAR